MSVIEPVHWVAEVTGVVVRLKPDRAVAAIALLTHSRFSMTASRAAYRRAAQLSEQLDHAVALEEGATLVTADTAYFGKAKDLGGVQLLADFAM